MESSSDDVGTATSFRPNWVTLDFMFLCPPVGGTVGTNDFLRIVQSTLEGIPCSCVYIANEVRTEGVKICAALKLSKVGLLEDVLLAGTTLHFGKALEHSHVNGQKKRHQPSLGSLDLEKEVLLELERSQIHASSALDAAASEQEGAGGGVVGRQKLSFSLGEEEASLGEKKKRSLTLLSPKKRTIAQLVTSWRSRQRSAGEELILVICTAAKATTALRELVGNTAVEDAVPNSASVVTIGREKLDSHDSERYRDFLQVNGGRGEIPLSRSSINKEEDGRRTQLSPDIPLTGGSGCYRSVRVINDQLVKQTA